MKTYCRVCTPFLLAVMSSGAAHAVDKPRPRLVGGHARVYPQRIAPVTMVGGKVERLGDWIAYEPPPDVQPVHGGVICRTRNQQQCHQGDRHCHVNDGDGRVRPGTCVWFNRLQGCMCRIDGYDCFEYDDTGAPIDDWPGCGLGSSRWFFGPSYCNGAATNDMTVIPEEIGAEDTYVEFAWYWYCGGSGTEACIIVLTTAEDWIEPCGGFGGFYGGIAYDFGDLACDPGGYYYTVVDLLSSGLFHQMPFDGSGAHELAFYTTDFAPATCAQPMLWGTDPNRFGSQGESQWDDDAPKNGVYDPTECYSYAYGLCPDPLGAMVALCADRRHTEDECEEHGCVGGACVFKALVCKDTLRGNKLIAKGTGAPGDKVCVKDGDGIFVDCASVNSRGKWKNVEKNVPPGATTREACATTRTATCP